MKKKHFINKASKKIIDRGKYKQKLLYLLVISSTLVLLAGCQSGQKTSADNSIIDSDQAIESQTRENDTTDETTPLETSAEVETETETETETDIALVSPSVTEDGNEESTILFSELSKYQFLFSSGAGAWRTMLNINEDGSFKGEYSDSDMGDNDEGYPNGVKYSSTFEGKFTTAKRVNDYTYSVSIEFMKLEKEVESEEIIDGIKYIYSEPYGLDDAKEIYIYTKQAPIKELPEGFRSWVGYWDLSSVEEEYLPFYGLYNLETENGFSSYLID